MALKLPLPPQQGMSAEAYSYLFQLAQQLNLAFDQVGYAGTESRQTAAAKPAVAKSTVQENVQETLAEQYNSLKSLIIKTAGVYTLQVISSNGNTFKNGNIVTTLSAALWYGKENVTGKFTDSQFVWTRVSDDNVSDTAWNTAHKAGGKAIDITAEDVTERATFFCTFIDTSGNAYPAQITITDLSDGADAALLRIDSSRGTVFKNNAVETVLSAVIYVGSKRITDIESLREHFGRTAYLEWGWQKLGESTFGKILSTDSRLGNDGFTFTLSPEDVDTKVNFVCSLITD